MNDEQYLRQKYPDFLGEDASSEQVRLVRDYMTMASGIQPPPGLAASIKMTLNESDTRQPRRARNHSKEAALQMNDEQQSPYRGPSNLRRIPFVQPLRRGLGIAGFASFALIVGAIAFVLSLTLSQMQPGTTPAAPAQAAATPTIGIPVAVPTRVDLPETAVSPLLKGAEVLHIKGMETFRTEQGEILTKHEMEFWYDRATGDARLERRNVLGVPSDQWILMHEGGRYLMYNRVTGMIDATTQANPSGMLTPVDQMFKYKASLDNGTMKQATGVAAPEGRIAAVLATAGANPSVVFLDKATGLGLKASPYRRLRQNGELLYEYPVIETLGRASLSTDLFDMDALGVEIRMRPTEVPPVPVDINWPTPESAR